MELKIIWDIIWRRKWIILQAFLIISLTIIIGSFLLPPVYESTSLLLLEKSTTESSLLANIGLQSNKSKIASDNEYSMGNNISIATSKPILNTVISNLQLSNSKGELLEADEILKPGLLQKIDPHPSIEVNAGNETDLFEIVSTSTDPDEAAMIANTLAEECIKNNLRQKKEDSKKTRQFIAKQIKTVKKKYIQALNELKKFSMEQKTLDIEFETTDTVTRISELLKEKENTVIDLSEKQARINELQKQLNIQNEQIILGTLGTTSSDDYITELRNSIINYEIKLEEVVVEKKKDHPDVKIIERKLTKARSALNHEILLSKQYSTNLLSHKRDLAALKSHLHSLNKGIDTYMNVFSSLSEKIFNNAPLNLNLDINQALYKTMLGYLYQIRIAELTIFPDIRIIEKATAADIEEPESPNMLLNCILGIFLGLTCGISLGFLMEYLDDTIKTQEDIRKTGATLLGSVPKFKQKGNLLISGKSLKDPVCETYRSIRNNINFSNLDKSIKSLLVTSSIDGEGKTTTACNLAISMTYEGKNVLLVDMDYRSPRIHEVFNLHNHIGSTNILAQPADISTIQESGIEKLSILPSGPIPPDPARLIESKKMKELIYDLSSRFDIVIIDSPPLIIANDAVILAGIVDAFISVTESHKETYSIFNQAKEICVNANIKPIGIVLNKFRAGRPNTCC